MSINEEKRCNELNGKEWLQNSFSIWRISKTKEEKALKHPASYPIELCEKLICTFTKKRGTTVLDPFDGIGSAMVACKLKNRNGIGIELSDDFCNIAKNRIKAIPESDTIKTSISLICGDSFIKIKKLEDNTIDLCLTSPPYWDILNMKRSADKNKNIAAYSNKKNDVGNIANYEEFLSTLQKLFTDVYRVLKINSYCIVNIMDIRKKDKFFPLHSDFSTMAEKIGFVLDDIIIWDRQQEYNNMRPLGYPYKYRINKVHEYLLIFIKK